MNLFKKKEDFEQKYLYELEVNKALNEEYKKEIDIYKERISELSKMIIEKDKVHIAHNSTIKEISETIEELSQHLPSFGAPRHVLNKLWLETSIALSTDENKKEEIKKEYEERQLQARSSAFENGQIIYAFTCGGIDYFKFADFNNMPPLRSLKTMVYYEEMRCKTSLEYLELHTQAYDIIIKKIQDKIKVNVEEVNKLDEQAKQGLFISLDNDFINTIIKELSEIKKLNDQLKQRLFIAVDVELMYKVASIIYFDKDEDFTDYNFDYNARKVQHWKKHDGAGFFLRPPLLELMPILKNMSGSLETYSQVVEQMNEQHLESILSNLPPNVREKLKNKSSFLQAGMQQN